MYTNLFLSSRKLFVAVAVYFLLVACSHEQVITPSSSIAVSLPKSMTTPKVQNGMLAFQSFDHYKQYAQFI